MHEHRQDTNKVFEILSAKVQEIKAAMPLQVGNTKSPVEEAQEVISNNHISELMIDTKSSPFEEGQIPQIDK